MSQFIQVTFLIWILVTLLWAWSVLIKNVSIVDIFWGFGFVVVNTFYVYNLEEINPRNWLLLALVSIWGLRLSIYLALRNIGKGEDFRYQQFRKDYGEKRYWWFSYFQVFLLQGGLILIVSLPLLGIHSNTTLGEFIWLDYIAIFVWGIGFSFEAGGDYQLYQFKKNPSNKGKVLNTGFWRYTRHPNYFGEIVLWSGIAIIVFPVLKGTQFVSLISPVFVFWLLTKVSGVPLLEKHADKTWGKKKDYIKYKEDTPILFPKFFK